MVATVVGLEGALAGERFTVSSDSITFGRDDENDVVLTNLLTSRVHAELRHQDGGYVLHDRGSSNGTWVNRRRVTVHRLQPGDQVVWKTAEQGNVRRQQVVTIQSRQFLKLPPEVQERLFISGAYSEMWPKGPDSIQDLGAGDSSMYALDGARVRDMVLGLRVKSELPDPMAVLLTVAQNRFLLNSLHGEGFLNMRLTDQEAGDRRS